MKGQLVIIFILCFSLSKAQINIIPITGVNTTKMSTDIGYQSGGTYGVAGMEIELRKPPVSRKAVHLSWITGVSYLANGFHYTYNFSFTALGYYTHSVTDISMKYFQIPAVIRLNWQPFPLVENWRVFLGAGVSYNTRTDASISEEYTVVVLSTDIFAPPKTSHYEDSRNVSSMGNRSTLFSRLDFGMTYQRLQITWRLSKSISDVYFTGLEKDWAVPADKSEYLSSNQVNGKTVEKYSELVVGIRLFK